MPHVQIDTFEGKTEAQKKNLMEAVTRAVVETLGVAPESVTIVVRDVPLSHWSMGGIPFSELLGK